MWQPLSDSSCQNWLKEKRIKSRIPHFSQKSSACARFRVHLASATRAECTLTLAVSLGLRPNPPKALPLETAQGAALRIR